MLLNSIRTLDNGLARIEKILLFIVVFTMIGMAVLQIILRNGFGFGIVWAESFIRILVLWSALIGAMLAAKTNEHIKIDVALHKLPEKYLTIVTRLLSLFVCIICFIAAYHSYLFVLEEYNFPNTAFSQVPTWACAAIIPLFFVITGLRYFFLLIVGDQSRTSETS